MDTSRMRVTRRGQGGLRHARCSPSAWLPTAEVAAVLQPGHAGPGDRHDHRLQDRRCARGGSRTVGRQLFSLILVPLQKLTEKEIPRDGSDICANALRAALAR